MSRIKSLEVEKFIMILKIDVERINFWHRYKKIFLTNEVSKLKGVFTNKSNGNQQNQNQCFFYFLSLEKTCIYLLKIEYIIVLHQSITLYYNQIDYHLQNLPRTTFLLI
jgi:hypothetical protein